MLAKDTEKYVDFRMALQLFEALLTLVGSVIVKEHVVREPTSPDTRLQITLRFLASGDSMKSLSYALRVAHNTISKIVPPNSGSTYYNYKGHHSIKLFGISDANYCFTIVDIGAEGRQSDGGVFRNSKIGKRFEVNSFKLPNPKQIEIDGPELSYVLVADEAFPLSMYMMRPYPRSGKLDIGKKIFNYRISRARRVVENAFGMEPNPEALISLSKFAELRPNEIQSLLVT
ncbi:nuclease harbi1 [Lasius niger]|uniref:Nuclease harbi1 n=1 Tax=Lasius niger TaxID=67767 RepID=A0A0J7KJ62_LASNI|nr:nuclease harbi1 [Lasius niger]